jgi:hypothetical protein
MKKWIGWALVAALVIIQFIRPERNEGIVYTATHISAAVDVPEQVKSILERSCNDCHSNKTNYPWYFNTQPLAWWLADHIEEGKSELNFSEFDGYRLKRKLHKLEEIAEQVKEGEMPMESYTWLHPAAELSEHDKEVLISWAMNAKASMDTVKVAKQ